MRKIILVVVCICLVWALGTKIFANEIPNNYTGWINDSGKYYYYVNGVMKKSCWINRHGEHRYFLRKDGSAATGKIVISGIEYNFDEKGIIIPDSWGITAYVSELSPTGLTFVFSYNGEKINGKYLSSTNDYYIELYNGKKWLKLLNESDSISDAIEIGCGDNKFKVLFSHNLYPGKYRICKEVTCFRKTGDYDTKTYSAYFQVI